MLHIEKDHRPIPSEIATGSQKCNLCDSGTTDGDKDGMRKHMEDTHDQVTFTANIENQPKNAVSYFRYLPFLQPGVKESR